MFQGNRMDKKQIQEQRMKGYFIQATKELLKGEGLRSISVRNIADRAGYSYATLYNYFKDIKDLIFLCVQDFQEECQEFINTETKKSVRGIGKINAITKAYMKYFIQYPGTFELFFLERFHSISGKQQIAELICNFLDRLCSDEWEYCIDKKIMKTEDAEIMKNELRSVTTGLLLMYLNRRYPNSYAEFMKQADAQIIFVIDKKLKAKKK